MVMHHTMFNFISDCCEIVPKLSKTPKVDNSYIQHQYRLDLWGHRKMAFSHVTTKRHNKCYFEKWKLCILCCSFAKLIYVLLKSGSCWFSKQTVMFYLQSILCLLTSFYLVKFETSIKSITSSCVNDPRKTYMNPL